MATLLQKKFAGEIVLIGEEPWLPYQRPPLSKKFLAKEMPPERLHFKADSFYDHAQIRVLLNTTVDSIDRDGKTVTTGSGETISYDQLVLSLGSSVKKLELPGSELPGIHYLRTIQDVIDIHNEMSDGCELVIVGAGYIGLEVAAVSRELGNNVTVIEMAERVMSRVVSPEVSRFYEKEHRSHGVNLLLSTGIRGFAGDARVTSVELTGGESIPADLVIVGVGIVPNTELASMAGLEVEDGIVVDEFCRTSDPSILAVGDCTRHPNRLLGRSLRLESVHNALEQAKTAACVVCGEDEEYAQVPWFWSDQYDLKLQIAGISQGHDQTIIRGDPDDRSFSCLYLRDGKLIAVDAIRNPKDFVQSKALIANQARIDPELLADASVMLKDMIQL